MDAIIVNNFVEKNWDQAAAYVKTAESVLDLALASSNKDAETLATKARTDASKAHEHFTDAYASISNMPEAVRLNRLGLESLISASDALEEANRLLDKEIGK